MDLYFGFSLLGLSSLDGSHVIETAPALNSLTPNISIKIILTVYHIHYPRVLSLRIWFLIKWLSSINLFCLSHYLVS